MFVFGNYEIAGTELAGQYDLFVSYCDKGDTVNAERLGTDLLNNSKYRSVMTDKCHRPNSLFFGVRQLHRRL